MTEFMICGLCGRKAYLQNDNMFRCDTCGATNVMGTWKFICDRCGRETDKLYDLFVPHHCKECSDELHEIARKENDRCLNCGALRMDCCC